VLFLEVPGQEVDVNVHPQKLEVRFSRSQEVAAAVRHVVGAAIARAPWLASAARSYGVVAPAAGEGAREPAWETPTAGGWSVKEAGARAAAGQQGFDRHRERSTDRDGSTAPLWSPGLVEAVRAGGPPAPEGEASLSFFGDLRYIGQLHRTYLVCEAPGELVLVDQHASHERLTFQRLRRAYRARQVRSQRLLFPAAVELDEAAQASVDSEAAQRLLEGLGFEVEGWGGRQLTLRAVPELLGDADPEPLLLDALHGLGEGPHRSEAEDALDHLFATLACHGSRRAGDVMTPQEAEALLTALDASDFRSHCPHGRPVLVRFSISELERRFGRA
jgi:DNA mismatch repair protein MutL